MDDDSWIEPTPALPGAAPLTAAHVVSWRQRGAAVVQDLFPPAVVAAAREAASANYADRTDISDAGLFGSDGGLVFPFEDERLNELTLHPRLLAAVAQLLDSPVRDLRLTQSDVWAKFGARGESAAGLGDQRIHVDYPNHTLTHPPPWTAPEAVEIIVYMDHLADTGGATAVVLREGADDPAYRYPIVDTPGVGRFDWVNDRIPAEEHVAEIDPEVARWRRDWLYARERRVRFSPGTVLLYRHDTWHRGTPIIPGALRVVQNLTIRRSAAAWISTVHEGWAWSAYRPSQVLERLIATSTADQRCLLGFPAPGDRFWTDATIAAVQARYARHGLDMAEYRSAQPSSSAGVMRP